MVGYSGQCSIELRDGWCYRNYKCERKALVWPTPTADGLFFVVEFEDGTCNFIDPICIRFLDSKKQFDQYSWEEA